MKNRNITLTSSSLYFIESAFSVDNIFSKVCRSSRFLIGRSPMNGDGNFGNGIARARTRRSTDKIDSSSLELFCTAEDILASDPFINNTWLIIFSSFFFPCSFNFNISSLRLSIFEVKLKSIIIKNSKNKFQLFYILIL